MPRLIDADELMKTIKAHHYLLKTHLNSTDYGMFTLGIQHAVDEQPIVDAVRVVHGKWISKEDDFFSERTWACSACDTWFVLEDGTPEENEYNHCPHCGAKMDG